MKKAQSAGSAAGFVAVIALIIVLYILFLPADIREELLEGEKTGISDIVRGNVTLLSENPGRLDSLVRREYEHDISPIMLYKTTDSKEIWKENPFYIKRGWFDKRFKNVTFYLDDLDVIDNVLLVFSAKDGRGMLTVRLNGIVVYEGFPESNIDPIKFRREELRKENILEFSVSSVGARFWSTNEYVIQNLVVVGDITDVTRQESKNVFMVDAVEYFNLGRASLRFNPDCVQEHVGPLDIYMNNRNLYSGIPDCATPNLVTIPLSFFNEGSNSLVFRTSGGSYLVDHIKVKTELKDIRYPFYSFKINKTVMREIEQGKLDIFLIISFIDNKEYRNAKVYVNGHVTYLSTDAAVWKRTLKNYIEEGTNELEVVPEKSVLDITSLKVVLAEDKK